MAKRKQRVSVWKNGKEYFWSPKHNRFECWFTQGKRRICEVYNEKQLSRNITPREAEALLKCVSDSDDKESYWRLKEILSSIIKQNDKQDFSLYQKPNPNAPLVETAMEYVEQIDHIEVEEYQKQKAERRKEKVQKHADLCSELMLDERRERELMAKLKQSSSLIQNQDRDLGEDDLRKWNDELKDVRQQIASICERVKTRKIARAENRESVNKRLRILFPNRGGKELLDEGFQREVRNLFAKYNQENIAIQIIEIYNAIGRCYNVKRKDFEQPTVSFAKILDKDGKQVLGEYHNNKITINTDIKNDPYNLRRALAHELGHWLESIVCKMGPCNRKWLKQKQGAFVKIEKEEVAPFDNYPNLCVDDYAQTARGDHTEIITVAMQELVSDPEVFAMRSPEHFNWLLENLREMSK